MAFFYHRTAFLLLCLIIFPASLLNAAVIGGVTVPDIITLDGHQLNLNGGGKRTKFMIGIYAASLYLEKKTNSTEDILQPATVKVLQLNIIFNFLTVEKMKQAMLEGFQNSLGSHYPELANTINTFINLLGRKVSKGDQFQFRYLGNHTVSVYKESNQEYLGCLEGELLTQAFYKIWLGEKPVQDSLKKELLGNS